MMSSSMAYVLADGEAGFVLTTKWTCSFPSCDCGMFAAVYDVNTADVVT